MLADFDQLAVGFFVSPANGNLEHRNGGPTGMDVLNVRFATAETFRVWAEVPVAEVWQWVALATFRDPSTVPPEAALSRHVRKRSAARLFQDRVTTLGRLVKHLGALQCVSVAADGKRSLVRLGDFREWSKGVGLSLPLEFPRPSGGSKVSARRGAAAADGAFLRVNDMIPALLPFSPATLWRKVKSGEFPPPVKLSDAANA